MQNTGTLTFILYISDLFILTVTSTCSCTEDSV